MLAVAGDPPAQQRGWAVEFKYDGLRARALRFSDGSMDLVSRNGNPLLSSFPELAVLREVAGQRSLVLDGEIVCLRSGRPDFAALQTRMHVQRPSEHLQRVSPASYIAFDLIALDGDTLTGLDYRTRRDLLASLGLSAAAPTVQVPPHYEDLSIEQMLTISAENGLEGVVVKRLASRYQSGRSNDWRKIPLKRTTEALVGGWLPGRGALSGTVGALLIGAYTPDGRLAFLGSVSSGLTNAQRRALTAGLPELSRPDSPFAAPLPDVERRTARWVEPLLVVDVAYRELTKGGRLRHPSFRGVRADREPDEVVVPTP